MRAQSHDQCLSTDDELPYDRIARVLQFNADGTGFCELYYLMDETMVFGDANRYGDDAQLTYTIGTSRTGSQLPKL